MSLMYSVIIYLSSTFLVETASFLKLFVKRSSGSVFKNQNDTFFVVKIVVHSDNIWVSHMRMNCNFSLQLIECVALDKVRFEENLNKTNTITFTIKIQEEKLFTFILKTRNALRISLFMTSGDIRLFSHFYDIVHQLLANCL